MISPGVPLDMSIPVRDGDPRAIGTVNLGVVTPMANEAGTAVAVRRCRPRRVRGARFGVGDVLRRPRPRLARRDAGAPRGATPRSGPSFASSGRPRTAGVADAYVRGYREALAAGCDWILEIDAGLQPRSRGHRAVPRRERPRATTASSAAVSCPAGATTARAGGARSAATAPRLRTCCSAPRSPTRRAASSSLAAPSLEQVLAKRHPLEGALLPDRDQGALPRPSTSREVPIQLRRRQPPHRRARARASRSQPLAGSSPAGWRGQL